jgi:sugar phosphate isomerase/epimerase
MDYSYVHTAGTYDFIAPEKFKEYACEAGLSFCGTHYDFGRIQSDIDVTVRYHEILGTRNIGVGGMPMQMRGSVEGTREFIKEFNRLACEYGKRGYKLTYHNHAFEFRKTPDGKTHFDRLIEELDPENTSFVFDTYWAQYAGIDVRMMIERLKGRIDILHLKDLKVTFADEGRWAVRQQLCEIGNGNLAWDRILRTAEATGVKHIVVEQDNGWIDGDPFKSLEFSKKYLDQYLG